MAGLEELFGESTAIQAVRENIQRLLARPHAGRRGPAVLGRSRAVGIGGVLFLSACAHTEPGSLRGDHEVEGRIVNVRGERMWLNNGMELLIPQDVARWSQLALGSVVRVRYEERDGQKVATSMVFT